jgi:hypothetical protein
MLVFIYSLYTVQLKLSDITVICIELPGTHKVPKKEEEYVYLKIYTVQL